MKKLLIVCAFVLGAVTFASAQGGGQGGGGMRQQMAPEDRAKQLVEKLKLNDDQKAKAVAVYTDAAAAQKKMREEMQAGGDMAGMREKMTKMTADVDAKINAFLTDDQKTAYKAWQDEVKAAREKAMKERQQGGGNNGK